MYMNISIELVKELIDSQFPEYSQYELTEVDFQGVDNRTFRIGNKYLARLPSAKCYEGQVLKEQKFLPLLKIHLSYNIPTFVKIGKPSKNYPFNWSIYEWIEGKSLNLVDQEIQTPVFKKDLAIELANFLNELHKIPIESGVNSGKHNFYRGSHPRVYEKNFFEDLEELKHIFNIEKLKKIWQENIKPSYKETPVWVHGDIAIGNLLIQKSKLHAILDFGCMAIGDPACDLVIYWNYFDFQSAKIFKSTLNLSEDVWQRAKCWHLWKNCFEIRSSLNKNAILLDAKIESINKIIDNC